mmetsp:Transcript_105690/g.268536  ORF Transcript_105690/g.268536 Transcript_105690/m.268536 type:complete len:180 (+) Transcript_105690:89-628(+)
MFGALRCVVLVALSGVSFAEMVCPGSEVFIHAGVRVIATLAASCDAVRAEAVARVEGQASTWRVPHGGEYLRAELGELGGDLSFSWCSGDGTFFDKMVFSLTPLESNSTCQVEACSESQTASLRDRSRNYCNLKMLYCGSEEGCLPVVHDLHTTAERTKKSRLAEANLRKCTAVPLKLI